jgi:hypothetical protein
VCSGVLQLPSGHTFASSALMAPMTKMFVTAIHDFVDRHELDLVHFTKGQRKDDLTQSYLAGHDGTEGVLYVGRAQEKASVMRTERRYDSRTGASYAWLVKASALVNCAPIFRPCARNPLVPVNPQAPRRGLRHYRLNSLLDYYTVRSG